VSGTSLKRATITVPDQLCRSDRTTARVALVTGIIFVAAGLVKFVFHHWELDAFRTFGLPWPSALEILAGVLEVVGGLMLLWRRYLVPTAAVLAVTMVVAIGASGIGHGDVIPSLTLAPALLLAMLYLLARGLLPLTRAGSPVRGPARSRIVADGNAGTTQRDP
jgi:uncharacterized membrane protein YphA (DoxX/SURF4 family)